MKKLSIVALMLAAFSFMGFAQTEFRHISFDEALKAAQTENKLVFIDFFTDWCGPCKKMAKQVFPLQNVGEYMNATFIPLKLDAEKEGAALAKKYGVNAYPTYVIIDGNGVKKNSFSGAMDGDQFIAKLKQMTDPNQTPERIKARYEGGERTPELVNAYAMMFMENRNEPAGYKVINEYFDSLSDAQRLKPENNFIFTTYTFELDSPRGKFLMANRDKFAPENREAVKNHIGRLLWSEFSKYYSGYMWKEKKFNADTYAQLKKDIEELGLNADGSYTPMYAFIESRVKMNDNEYFAFCEKNYDKLNDRAKDLFVANVGRLFPDTDAELNGKVAGFLRGKLATMTPLAIQYAGRSLQSLEKNAAPAKEAPAKAGKGRKGKK